MGALQEYHFKIRSQDNLLCRFTQDHPEMRIVLTLLRSSAHATVEKAIVTILADRDLRRRFLTGEFAKRYGTFEILSEDDDYASVEISTAVLSYYQRHDPIQATIAMLGPETVFHPVVVEGGYIFISVVSPNPEGVTAFNAFTQHMRRVVPADDFKLLHIGEFEPEARLHGGDQLTPRQEEVIRLAMRMGYYSDPRGCRLEDVAQALGISKAAVHKRLQLAENTIMRARLGSP